MKSKKELSVISLQPNITLHNLEENLHEYKDLFHERLDQIDHIDIICFPEYWNGLRINSSSEKAVIASKEFLKNTALRYSSWIVGGSFIIKENNQFFNRSLIYNSKGEIVGKYDKIRLFGYEKTQDIIPGNSLFTWKIGEFCAGIRICNDLWNLNLVQELINQEIDILFVPALTVVPEKIYTNYGQHIWHNLAFIRAKEGSMVIVVSDTHRSILSDPYWSTGASCIADPSQKFTNEEARGQNMLNKINSGSRGIIWKILNLHELRAQRNYREFVGLLTKEP
jgi:predicted amidohydrolase